jgi:hypothetical protein
MASLPKLLCLGTALSGIMLALGRHLPYHPQKIFFDFFLRPSPISNDPFTHLMTDVDPLPDLREYSYLQFFIPTAIGGPLLFVVYGMNVTII